MDMQYDQARDTRRAQQARDRLETRFKLGEREQQQLLQRVAKQVITDRLVPPHRMFFLWGGGGLRVAYGDASKEYMPIHGHALTQMCAVAGITKIYVNRLLKGERWERELLEHNMNELFHKGKYLDRRKQPSKFLSRSVDNQVRGFLSRSFNRNLASAPLLRSFIQACDQAGAKPAEAGSSPIHFSLKYFLPLVFEPVDGEFVTVGSTWSNSDFGSGRMRVAMSAMRISSGTTSILEDAISRVHIGSIIQESDIELSNEASQKELAAQQAAVKSAVQELLQPENVNRLLTLIRMAHEEQVPWHKLKDELGKLLQKKELDTVEEMLRSNADDIIDLPQPSFDDDGEPVANRWWASNALSHLAAKEGNAERKKDLQLGAGTLLGKTKGTAKL